MKKVFSIFRTTFLFFLFTFIGFTFLPNLLTSENYDNSSEVNPLFPVVIIEESFPIVVKWSEYEANSIAPKRTAYTTTKKESVQLSEFELFTIEPLSDGYHLNYYTDDYTFKVSYAVEEGKIRPITFRYTGAFIAFYALPIALVLTIVSNLLIKILLRRAR